MALGTEFTTHGEFAKRVDDFQMSV